MKAHVDDPEQAVAAWRASGAHRLDPVRFALIEALMRRSAMQEEAVRRVLQVRLATLVAAYGEQVEASRAVVAPPASGAASGPLAALAERLGGERGAGELKALAVFRRAWSRLRARRRLAQSLATLPEHPGPLNSQHLVQRMLSLMHDASPEYFERFVGYVETLLWLEQARAPRGGPSAKASRPNPAP